MSIFSKRNGFFLHFRTVIVLISFCSFRSKAILLSIIPHLNYRFKQFLWILIGWCIQHRFAKVHMANRKQITGKKTSWVANMIFKEPRLFLRCPSLENYKPKNYFPIKQYRIWICTSPISFHRQIVEMVSQIQYDAPWTLFDTYLAELNVGSIK